MHEISPTFCVKPFLHLATLTDGAALPCCVARDENQMSLHSASLQELWNSPYLRQMRLAMLRGEKFSACTNCYIEEENGYPSHRKVELGVWKDKAQEIVARVQATNAEGFLAEPLTTLDLRIGNTCNLQCVMCKPQESSKWLGLADSIAELAADAELKGEWDFKRKIEPRNFNWFEKPEFLASLQQALPQVTEIILGGGEPMLLKQHRWLLEECVRSGAAPRIRLRYHTNGTVLPQELFPLWEKFQLVELFLSLDGLGSRNAYMRYPADWSAIESHLRILDSLPLPNVKIMILSCMHLLSCFYATDFLEWIEGQGFRKVTHGFSGYFHPAVVHHPEYLSIQAYPRAVKENIASRLRAFEARSKKPSYKIEGVLQFMLQRDTSYLLPRTKEFLRQIDHFRGTEFESAFPELYDVLGFALI